MQIFINMFIFFSKSTEINTAQFGQLSLLFNRNKRFAFLISEIYLYLFSSLFESVHTNGVS